MACWKPGPTHTGRRDIGNLPGIGLAYWLEVSNHLQVGPWYIDRQSHKNLVGSVWACWQPRSRLDVWSWINWQIKPIIGHAGSLSLDTLVARSQAHQQAGSEHTGSQVLGALVGRALTCWLVEGLVYLVGNAWIGSMQGLGKQGQSIQEARA